jgi:hypothetical protein
LSVGGDLPQAVVRVGVAGGRVRGGEQLSVGIVRVTVGVDNVALRVGRVKGVGKG